MPGNGNVFTVLIVGAVVVFVLFRRARSMFTRQKIRSDWLTFRIAVFAALGGAILVLTLNNVPSLLVDLVGLAIGAGIAWLGLRLTTFERQPDGLYFTPNLYIGLGVFALFLVRLVYRLIAELNTVSTLTG